MDVQAHIAALASSAEGILARAAVLPPSALSVALEHLIIVEDWEPEPKSDQLPSTS
jgi:hypothetical protein